MAVNGPWFHRKGYVVTKLEDFSKIRHKNVEYFNLVHASNPKFGHRPFQTSFLPFSSPFSRSFLLLLPFEFHIFSGCLKKLSVN